MKNPFNWLIDLIMQDAPVPMREAYGPLGITIDNDDADWRPLSGDGKRDLAPMTQRRMQDLAVYLWESNLLANRLIELPVAYILAEGVKLKAEDETVQEVIDGFWRHSINSMNIKLVKKVRELALYGEQCWPTFVNEFSGAVRLGYLDPGMIETVIVDPDNGEQAIGVVTCKNKKGESKRYRVIVNGTEEELFTKRTIGIRDTFTDGDAFYFCINDLSNGRRGRSDLLPQTDWLDSYDQFMFGELDRIQFLRAFMWDVTLTGANEDDVKKKAASIRSPSPGSVRVHNDAESWKAESPNINAADTDTTATLLRNHILGGATIPEHWFGGAGDVNRATGEDMSGPTFKVMSMRQAYIGHMLVEVGKFVIRQWELAHNGKEPDLNDPIYELEVSWPEMIPKDAVKYASALGEVVKAAKEAVDGRLLSRHSAIEIIEKISAALGVKIDAEAELLEIDATAPPVPESPDKPEKAPVVANTKPEAITEAVNTAKQQPAPAPPAIDPSPVSAQTDLLAVAAGDTVKKWLDIIRNKVDAADSLEALREALLDSYGDLDSSELTRIMALAFAAADLSGRFDVNQEANGH